MNEANLHKPADARPENDPWLKLVREQVGSLRQGVVEIVIHEGRVVEIKTSERVQLENPSSSGNER